MPTRHGGRLASRASTWPRDHFCRSMIAPRSSWPTTWNEFLPISMPTVAILEMRGDMACSLSSVPQASFHRWWGWSTAGPSHSRTSRQRDPLLHSYSSTGFHNHTDLGPTLRFGRRHGINDRASLGDQHDEHVWFGILEAHDDAAA